MSGKGGKGGKGGGSSAAAAPVVKAAGKRSVNPASLVRDLLHPPKVSSVELLSEEQQGLAQQLVPTPAEDSPPEAGAWEHGYRRAASRGNYHQECRFWM